MKGIVRPLPATQLRAAVDFRNAVKTDRLQSQKMEALVPFLQ